MTRRCRPVLERQGISLGTAVGERGHKPRGGERHQLMSTSSWLENTSQRISPDSVCISRQPNNRSGDQQPPTTRSSRTKCCVVEGGHLPSLATLAAEEKERHLLRRCLQQKAAQPCRLRPSPRRPEPSCREQQILAVAVLDDHADVAGGLLGWQRGGKEAGG